MSEKPQALGKNAVNYISLSPLSFLKRTALTYPNHPAIIYGEVKRNWGDTYERCIRLASALRKAGVRAGDTVSVMAPNIPAMFEAHFGVPMSGAVLNALNTRLDAAGIAFILNHAGSKVLIVDREYAPLVQNALEHLTKKLLVIEINDPATRFEQSLDVQEYEDFINSGSAEYKWHLPEDEWDSIALNYTSGTTGDPKGVVYHHRGAYLNALGNVTTWALPHHPVYLWTLPMFHCNGWCFPWTITAMAGTHVCLRKVSGDAIYAALSDHQVSHMCGAPVIMGMLINTEQAESFAPVKTVKMMTAGAAPPASVLIQMEKIGFDVTHVYGLTEVYGPAVVCAWHAEWDDLPVEKTAALKARQGVKYHVLEDFFVADPDTMEPVPADGKTMGELMMRGNIVMKGYHQNPEGTKAAFSGGAFHTGDLGVMHPDGYVEIKDRSKDIVISGGENISTIEVEGVLYHHPDVLEAAVVAKPDDKWGETPCAFVTLRPGKTLQASALIAHCKDNLAHYKCPKSIVFMELPKTSTGKIQKHKLREIAKSC